MNKKNSQPKIVAISGCSGSGKTTLAKELANTLKATLISWDDYDSISVSPKDYVKWHESGRPDGLAAWKYPHLATDLNKLKRGECILSKLNGNEVHPKEWIIFDSPLGRDHLETGQYIDYHIHLNPPLDIALVRRTLRDFSDKSTAKDVLEDLEYYLNRSRPLFLIQPSIEPDLILDGEGTLQLEKKVEIVIKKITSYYEEQRGFLHYPKRQR